MIDMVQMLVVHFEALNKYNRNLFRAVTVAFYLHTMQIVLQLQMICVIKCPEMLRGLTAI